MLSGVIINLKTASEWEEYNGSKVFKEFLDTSDKNKLYDYSQVCQNLQVCQKCGEEYDGDCIWLYQLMKVTNPKLVEDYDNVCMECLEHHLKNNNIDVEQLLNMTDY